MSRQYTDRRSAKALTQTLLGENGVYKGFASDGLSVTSAYG